MTSFNLKLNVNVKLCQASPSRDVEYILQLLPGIAAPPPQTSPQQCATRRHFVVLPNTNRNRTAEPRTNQRCRPGEGMCFQGVIAKAACPLAALAD